MSGWETLLSAICGDGARQEDPPCPTPGGYNIFQVLEVGEKEVVMCRFLADLLDPEGRHGCGILFLKSFLEDVLGEEGMSDVLLAHTDVTREYVIDDKRRIDIVIENADCFIPIEVKIYGGEQEGQCWDYYERARNAPMVYLTRFGDPPSAYSRRRRGGTEILPLERVRRISWASDIYGWLGALTGKLTEPVKSIVTQYMDAVRAMADGEAERAVERRLAALYRSPACFGAGVEIEKVMETAKLRLMRLVFEALREEMEPLAEAYGLEAEREARYYSYDDKRHERFYRCYSTYPGLNYVVRRAVFHRSGLQMWFRIEVEHNLFAGFALFDTEAPPGDGYSKGYQVDGITPELAGEAARYLDRDVIRPVDWWLTYCYSNGKRRDGYYDDVPDFKSMNPCAVSLVDPSCRREFARRAVKTFEERLLRYLL